MLFQFKIFNIFSGKVLTNTLFFAIILKSTMIDAGMAQSVEHVIGNDEVTSSNLVTSSKKGTSAMQMCLFWSCQLLTEMYHTKCEAFFVLSSNPVIDY